MLQSSEQNMIIDKNLLDTGISIALLQPVSKVPIYILQDMNRNITEKHTRKITAC